MPNENLQIIVTARDQASAVLSNISGELTSFGAAASKVALGMAEAMAVIAGALTAIAGASFVTLEKNMARVNTIAEMNAEGIRTMGDDILAMVGKVNNSAADLSHGLYQIYSAGFSGAQGMEVLEVAGRAASAGMTDTYTTVRAIASVLKAYGMQGEEASKVSDMLFTTVNRGILTFSELANSIGTVNAMAGLAKIPINEVGAAIATLTKKGLSADEATTALSRVIQSFFKPSDPLIAQLNEWGYATGDAALATEGLAGIMTRLSEVVGASPTGWNTLFDDLRAFKGAIGLAGDGLKVWNEDLEYFAEKATGTTEAAFETMEATVNARMEKIKNTFQAGLTLNFEDQGGFLNSLLENVQNAMPQILDFANMLVNAFMTVVKTVLDLLSGIYQVWQLIPSGGRQAILIIGAITVAWLAFNAAVKANPVIATIALIATAIGMIGNAIQAAVPLKTQMEEARKAAFDVEQAEQAASMTKVANFQKAKALLQEMADLQNATKTPEVLTRLKEIANEINRVFPEAKMAVEDVSGAVSSALGPLDAVYSRLQDYIDKIKELRKESLQAKIAEAENAKGELEYWNGQITKKQALVAEQQAKIAELAEKLGVSASLAGDPTNISKGMTQTVIKANAEAIKAAQDVIGALTPGTGIFAPGAMAKIITKEDLNNLYAMIEDLNKLQGELDVVAGTAKAAGDQLQTSTGEAAASLDMLSKINLGELVGELNNAGEGADALGEKFPILAKGFDEAISGMVVSLWNQSGTLWEAADTTFSRIVTILTETGVSMNDAMEIAGHGVVQSLLNNGVKIDEATKYAASLMEKNGYDGGVDYSKAIESTILAGMGPITAAAEGVARSADMGELWWSVGWNQGASYIDGIAESIASAAPALTAGSILAASYAPVKKVAHVPLVYTPQETAPPPITEPPPLTEPPPGETGAGGAAATPTYVTYGYPTQAGANFTPTATFGEEGPYWGAGGHRGLDIAAEMGSAVTALGEGVVTAVKNEGSWGNIVEVMLKSGIRVLYAHLQEQLVKVGDTVSQGTWLGTVGMTGTSTGPHLHIETSVNTDPLTTGIGNLVDPLTILGETFEDTTDAAYDSETATQEGTKKLYEEKYAIEKLAPSLQDYQDKLAALEKQSQSTGDSSKYMAQGQALIDAGLQSAKGAVDKIMPRLLELAATGQSSGEEYKYLASQLKLATTANDALAAAQDRLNKTTVEYKAARIKAIQDLAAYSAEAFVAANAGKPQVAPEFKTIQDQINWTKKALDDAKARLAKANAEFISQAGNLEQSSEAWKLYRQAIDDAQAAVDGYGDELNNLTKQQKELDDTLLEAMKPDDLTAPYNGIADVIDSITAKWKTYVELVKQGANPEQPQWNASQKYLLDNVGNILADLGVVGAKGEGATAGGGGGGKLAMLKNRGAPAESSVSVLAKYNEEAQKKSLEALYKARGWEWSEKSWESFKGLGQEEQGTILGLAGMQEAQDEAAKLAGIQKDAAEKQLSAAELNSTASKDILTASQNILVASGVELPKETPKAGSQNEKGEQGRANEKAAGGGGADKITALRRGAPPPSEEKTLATEVTASGETFPAISSRDKTKETKAQITPPGEKEQTPLQLIAEIDLAMAASLKTIENMATTFLVSVSGAYKRAIEGMLALTVTAREQISKVTSEMLTLAAGIGGAFQQILAGLTAGFATLAAMVGGLGNILGGLATGFSALKSIVITVTVKYITEGTPPTIGGSVVIGGTGGQSASPGYGGGGSPFHNVMYAEGGIAKEEGIAYLHAGEWVLPGDVMRAMRMPLPGLQAAIKPPASIRPPVQVGDIHIHDAPSVDRTNIREITNKIMAEIDRQIG